VDNSQSESIFRETIEVGDKQLLDEKVPWLQGLWTESAYTLAEKRRVAP
jgi:hypothetical protein